MSAPMKHRSAGRGLSDKKSGKIKSDRSPSSASADPDQRPPDDAPWTPSVYTAFKALLSARLCAAIWSHITDCDETFNYWEPMHYLLHGQGMQTWEYSPVYAIRSYAYLWIYALPLKLYNSVASGSHVIQFYFLRTFLACTCALCEVFFYKAVCKRFGPHVGRLLLVFLVFGSGMYVSSTALLPSTFSLYMTCLAFGGWFAKLYPLAIFGIGSSAIVGWPFAAALGIPIAYDLLYCQRRILFFIKWGFLTAAVCMVPLVVIDSHYYGKTVIAPLNIVLYNVFSEHGPDIYGVEPWTFYFINGFLNFNVVFLMAILAVPLILLTSLLMKQPRQDMPAWLGLGAMYIWMLIFFTRPHKEERFLFPIYPLICLAGAVMLDHTQRFVSWLRPGTGHQHYTKRTMWLATLCCVLYACLSVSRSVALYQGYHAPLDVYGDLTKLTAEKSHDGSLSHDLPVSHDLPADRKVNVCVGKEWYRFPSHFFMPSDKWRLQFIKSEFRGQLPQPYSDRPEATRLIPSHMNDQNLEEPSRYVELSECHYLVDLDLPRESRHEPRYSQSTEDWMLVTSGKYLDNTRSQRFLRAFYIPFLSEKFCTYVDYNLLQSTHYRKIKLG